MVDDRVKEQFAVEIVDSLVDLDDKPAGIVGSIRKWFDVRVEDLPLAGPVSAHRFDPVDVTALHAVRPLRPDAFGRERRRSAGVEIAVGSSKSRSSNAGSSGHPCFKLLQSYAVCPGAMMQMSGRLR